MKIKKLFAEQARVIAWYDDKDRSLHDKLRTLDRNFE